MTPEAEERLGYELFTGQFRPLPDIGRNGTLLGTMFWRVVGPHVEVLRIRPNGWALASRAWARFSFERPIEHGPVIETRRGEATNALLWLLDTSVARHDNHGSHTPAPPPTTFWEEPGDDPPP